MQNAEDLLHQWQHWLRHLSGLQLYGENAQAALSKLGGVSARQVELIMSALSEHKSGEVRETVAGILVSALRTYEVTKKGMIVSREYRPNARESAVISQTGP